MALRYFCTDCSAEVELVDGKVAHPPNGCTQAEAAYQTVRTVAPRLVPISITR